MWNQTRPVFTTLILVFPTSVFQVRKPKLDIFKGSLGYRQEDLLGAIIVVHSKAWTKTMEATMGVWGSAERVARGRVYRKEGTWAVGFRNQLG